MRGDFWEYGVLSFLWLFIILKSQYLVPVKINFWFRLQSANSRESDFSDICQNLIKIYIKLRKYKW